MSFKSPPVGTYEKLEKIAALVGSARYWERKRRKLPAIGMPIGHDITNYNRSCAHCVQNRVYRNDWICRENNWFEHYYEQQPELCAPKMNLRAENNTTNLMSNSLKVGFELMEKSTLILKQFADPPPINYSGKMWWTSHFKNNIKLKRRLVKISVYLPFNIILCCYQIIW